MKQYLSDERLCQAPLLVMPAARLARLQGRRLMTLPRNDLGKVAAQQFRKTANLLGSFPWDMERTKNYLLEWVPVPQQ